MLSTLGLMGAMRSLSSAFETATGVHVDADFAPTLALLERLRAGEAADLVILTRAGLDEMIGEGRVIADSAADLARSYVGLAVRAGHAHPDIANEAALRKTLLAAQSVAYSRLGASGVYFARLIVRMGIAAEINARATIVEQGFTAERLVSGEAELAVQQISELKQVEGIEVIGPVPHELQTPAVFSAGRMVDAKQAEAAEALLRYLTSPEVVPVLRQSGLELETRRPASLRAGTCGFEKELVRGTDRWNRHKQEAHHDSQTRVRRIPALFAQGESQDGQAPQPRHLQEPRGSRKARARRAVFQAALTPEAGRAGRPANQTLENNPMHSSQVADKTADWSKGTARCGFYEIRLTRRAKQGHAGIMAEKAPRAALRG